MTSLGSAIENEIDEKSETFLRIERGLFERLVAGAPEATAREAQHSAREILSNVVLIRADAVSITALAVQKGILPAACRQKAVAALMTSFDSPQAFGALNRAIMAWLAEWVRTHPDDLLLPIE
jgi:hypothetical protein